LPFMLQGRQWHGSRHKLDHVEKCS
jgi:hypothetical protein